MTMRIGINGTGLVLQASVDAVAEHAAQAAEDGFASYWLAEHPTGGFDALSVLALVGQRVAGIELGTAIVPMLPRHPLVLAGQALTARGVIGERLTLGIGLSHDMMMAQLGLNLDRPIAKLRDYLSVLMPLLNEGKVSFEGEFFSCQAEVFRKPSPPVPVLVAALGEQALRVAGTRTDGATLAWVGPRTVRDHIRPRLADAAAKAGRPAPRILATLPVCVTDEADKVRALVAKTLEMYGSLPAYRAMFEREGVAGPGELALVGNEDEVRARLGELADAGVTDFAASEFTPSKDERLRTRALLKKCTDEG
ncbi:MAG: TIGR03564 family F420-dependent LLM class oxidoreductase [Deltaproteobacteria bacterium]